MQHHVYVLRCSNGSLYTGYTVDLQRRLKQHNLGLASKYTRSRRPVVLAYYETLKTRSLALKREIEIKKLPRSKKIALISKSDATTDRTLE